MAKWCCSVAERQGTRQSDAGGLQQLSAVSAQRLSQKRLADELDLTWFEQRQQRRLQFVADTVENNPVQAFLIIPPAFVDDARPRS